MKSYSSFDVIRMLLAEGWYLSSVRGSHHHYRHLTKPGKIQVPHPKRDLKPKTAHAILKQAQLL